MYDVIIVWWWAAWIFCWINCDRKYKTLIIEKNKSLWRKVLLSWWERCNVSNEKIVLSEDYFSNSSSFELILQKHFKVFSNNSIKQWLSKNWIATKTEDRNRIILKSWNSKELVDIFTKELKKNWSKIMSDTEVLDVSKDWKVFFVKTNKWVFNAKKVVISTGWRSFSQVWTNWFGFNVARKFGISLIEPYKWLCWITTITDFSKYSWTTINWKIEIYLKNNIVYGEEWPILFTHFWFSWPVVFNSVLAIWKHLRLNWITACEEEDFLKKNAFIKIFFNKDNLTKKLRSEIWNNNFIETFIQNFRWRKEAKVTGWWVLLEELDTNFESKKVRWLYFIWEVVDVTWKTWWFNLQWAWTSGYVCWKNIYR